MVFQPVTRSGRTSQRNCEGHRARRSRFALVTNASETKRDGAPVTCSKQSFAGSTALAVLARSWPSLARLLKSARQGYSTRTVQGALPSQLGLCTIRDSAPRATRITLEIKRAAVTSTRKHRLAEMARQEGEKECASTKSAKHNCAPVRIYLTPGSLLQSCCCS